MLHPVSPQEFIIGGLIAGVSGAQGTECGLVERRLWSQPQADKVRIFPLPWRRSIGFLGLALSTTCRFLLSLYPLRLLAVSFTLCYLRWFPHVPPMSDFYSVAPRRDFAFWFLPWPLALGVGGLDFRASRNPREDINTAWLRTSSMELDFCFSFGPGSPKSWNGMFFGLGPIRFSFCVGLLVCQFLVSFMPFSLFP